MIGGEWSACFGFVNFHVPLGANDIQVIANEFDHGALRNKMPELRSINQLY